MSTQPMTKEEMIAQGVPPAVVDEVMKYAGMGDPSSLGQRALLSRTDPMRALAHGRGSKSIFGAIAQGLAGYGAGTAERKYADSLRQYGEATGRLRNTIYETDRRRNRGTAEMNEGSYIPQMGE